MFVCLYNRTGQPGNRIRLIHFPFVSIYSPILIIYQACNVKVHQNINIVYAVHVAHEQ